MIEMSVMVAVIVAIGQLIKGLDMIQVKYIPLVNLILGILFSMAFGSGDLKMDLFNGLIVGLTASGLYSGVKNISEGMRGERNG